MNGDPAYLTYFMNGACAVREKIPVRMLEITPQIVIALDVNVTYVQNDLRKRRKIFKTRRGNDGHT